MNEALDRIKDKIGEVEEYLGYLIGITPESFELYKQDLKTKAACEHYLEKVAEACVDLAFLIIKLKGLKIPRDDEDAFFVLSDSKIILPVLATRLKGLKGMQNVLAHQYGRVDDVRVYFTLSEEVERDVGDYIGSINKYLGLKG